MRKLSLNNLAINQLASQQVTPLVVRIYPLSAQMRLVMGLILVDWLLLLVCDPDDHALLKKLGVDDSKNLTDSKIRQIAPILETISSIKLCYCPHKNTTSRR